MKGLLIKDFRLLKGQVYFLLIVTGCVIVFMINGSEAFGVAYVCSMVALLSLTTVSYDEYENGCAFLFTLPITKKDYVKEKYLFAGILLLIGLIVSMIMWYITAVIKTGNIAWDDWMSCCIGGVTAGLMMVAVALPAQLKFGPERGRIALVAAKRYVYCGAERHTVCKADSNGSNTHYGNMGACACRYLRRQGCNKDTDAEHHRPAV